MTNIAAGLPSFKANFLGGSFNNRDHVRASAQFRRERQPQLFMIFPKEQSHPFSHQ